MPDDLMLITNMQSGMNNACRGQNGVFADLGQKTLITLVKECVD